MRIFNKMKKAMLVLAASLFCTSAVFAETVVSTNFDDSNALFIAWTGNTRTVTNGELVVEVPEAENAWDQQMAYDNSFKYKGVYTMKMKIKGSEAGKISANFQVTTDGYKDAGNFGEIAFGTDWTVFEATVECNQKAADRLIFNLGATASTIYIDDFELTVEIPEGIDTGVWTNILANSDLEGTNAVSFASKENGGDNNGATLASTITDGIGMDGSRGIKVKSFANATEDWDAQFWIVAPEVIPAGTEYRVSFDYRADNDVTVGTQAHGAPGEYIHYDMIGSPAFKADWQHYEKEGVITAQQAGDPAKLKSIAFNLSVNKENAVEFFFDNIKFEVYGAYDLNAYYQAVYDAQAFKAQLVAEAILDEETIQMAQEEIDAAIVYAKEGIDEATSQEDVDIAVNMLVETVEFFKSNYEAQKVMANIQKARAAGEETLAKYPGYTDEAGLVDALMNLPMRTMGYTVEELQAAIDAVYAAIELFEIENKPLEPGTYYMKNVGSGKFLTIGNDWGTRASLGAHGFDVNVEAVGNGKYTFDTKVSTGNHWLGVDGYVDQALAEWTLIKVNGNYAITLDGNKFFGYDGSTTATTKELTDANDVNAQWQFITREEFEAALNDASDVNPVDATFFISGQNFNNIDDNRNKAWQGGPSIGGRAQNKCAEKWNTNFDIYQDLTGLPNGYYIVSVQGFYRAGWGGTTDMTQNAYLYAGDASTPLMSINEEAGNPAFAGGTSDVPGYGLVPNDMNCASDAFSAGLYADNRVVAQVTDGTLRIGVKKDVLIGGDWTIFDNVMLTYYGSEDPTSLFEAIDSLNTLLVEVNEWVATLDATNEIEAQVIAQVEQGLMPAAQAVLAQPTSAAQVEEMITSVSQFLLMAQTSIAQYKAMEAMEFKASYNDPVDNAGFEEAYNEIFVIANGLATGTYTWADVEAALVKMNAARKEFIYENLPAPTVAVVAVQAGNRVVAMKNELEGVRTYYKTDADAEFKVYVAPFHISETTTVWGYSEYVDANQVVYTSDVMEKVVEAGSIIALNAPIITVEGIAEEVADDLTTDIFKTWNGVGADAQPTADAVYPEIHVGEELGAGAMVYGLSTVYYLSYADLTGYEKIVIEGTPGVQLRVLMNRVENEGALTEMNPVIGEDGTAVVDLTGMEYVHLNAIKTGWGSAAGTIENISLVNTDGEPTSFNCVVTSDQSAIINEYGITPEETITYEFFPWIESAGECAKVPSISGTLTSGEALNGLSSGLLIVKVAAYGFESAVTTKYLGASEEWEGGDAFVTDIDEVNAKEVKEIKFYTLSGVEIEEPTTGIYIQRILFTDGTVKTIKVAGK